VTEEAKASWIDAGVVSKRTVDGPTVIGYGLDQPSKNELKVYNGCLLVKVRCDCYGMAIRNFDDS